MTTVAQRYVIVETKVPARAHRRFCVWDKEAGKYATMPNNIVCFAMTGNDALDALIELRGGMRAEGLGRT